MSRTLARILLVDDYEPWCRFIRSTLSKRPQLEVVGVASDGLEAVQKAQELQPDLVLLDIALPKLNGLDVASSLRKVNPGIKILFLSQEHSSEVVQAGVRSGAMGYLLKSCAARELFPAIDSILAGERFFSGALEPIEAAEVDFRHEVEFYTDDAIFIERLGRYIHDALESGRGAVVVATPDHRAALGRALELLGFDTPKAHKEGRYVSLDARETLSKFLIERRPDPVRFVEVIGSILHRVSFSPCTGVAVFGEMVDLLWADGDCQAATELEQLWNKLALLHSFSLRCAYPASRFQEVEQSEQIKKVCALHSSVHSY